MEGFHFPFISSDLAFGIDNVIKLSISITGIGCITSLQVPWERLIIVFSNTHFCKESNLLVVGSIQMVELLVVATKKLVDQSCIVSKYFTVTHPNSL